MVMTCRGGFSISKNGSFWPLLVVQFYFISNSHHSPLFNVVVVALLFNVHVKHLRSCRDGQLT